MDEKAVRSGNEAGTQQSGAAQGAKWRQASGEAQGEQVGIIQHDAQAHGLSLEA